MSFKSLRICSSIAKHRKLKEPFKIYLLGVVIKSTSFGSGNFPEVTLPT